MAADKKSVNFVLVNIVFCTPSHSSLLASNDLTRHPYLTAPSPYYVSHKLISHMLVILITS